LKARPNWWPHRNAKFCPIEQNIAPFGFGGAEGSGALQIVIKASIVVPDLDKLLGFVAKQQQLAEKVYGAYEAGPLGYVLYRQLKELGVAVPRSRSSLTAPAKIASSGFRGAEITGKKCRLTPFVLSRKKNWRKL
jgi:hypothetical protein